MKTLYLTFSRIRQYYRNNKFIFVLFIIGGIINSMVFAYFYGNLISYNVGKANQEGYYRRYFVYLNSSLEKEVYEELCGNELIENVIVGHIISEENLYLFGTMNEHTNLARINGTLTFTDKYQVLIPELNSYAVGGNLTFFEKEFEIVGRHNNDNEYYIPYEAYKELGLEDNVLYVYAAKHQDPTDDKVAALIKEYFPDASIDTPAKYDTFNRRSMNTEIAFICTCYAFSAISFMFLLRHMLDSMVYDSAVCMITGASKSTISIMTFWEAMLLSLSTSVVGLAIHKIFYNVFFNKINIREEIVYKFSDYAFIFFLMFCITLVITLPFIIKYTRLTPITIRREQQN